MTTSVEASVRFSAREEEMEDDEDFKIPPFGFVARRNFGATKDLLKTRNDHIQFPLPPIDDDIWRRPPPDFRLQAWAACPPKRNTREAMKPWRYAHIGEPKPRDDEEAENKNEIRLPKLLRASDDSKEMPDFNTRFRPTRPFTAKKRAVARLMNKPGTYENPKPHDFRGLLPLKPFGLPEFTTESEKDPFNIKLELANRRTILGALHDIQNLRDVSGTMYSAVRQPEKWDPKQHLPHEKWPHRPLEYTRYRIQWRDPHVAFMDRVENSLSEKWSAEKMGKASDSPRRR